MANAEIIARIRQFLTESFLSTERAEELGVRDDLFKVLDSLQMLRLVLQLETLFGVKVADSDLTPENFGTLERIGSFVERSMPPAECQLAERS
ncbi:MAG TPA: acyl carrier protein [Gemmataceae bacterium]|nr:acyl carrier protein [Gemmataceae bacterium]